ncbi:hypothetical protein [Nocardia huaxiensis]|uniref:Parallel beta helix pectate lyase-like protein n=1 Tax=Nocardia huaxiensis TaxID=2755382 RepID=A0A7D6VNU8_9NOCA|nr:hypothetical protein [Nocardia huaxiensis]QLY33910.1 hypothetical protein H0264_18240 [Nocardia huaxiensis]UFS99155.1 hypothetical protein LPY97_15275 [Nocardia huaxiensis]
MYPRTPARRAALRASASLLALLACAASTAGTAAAQPDSRTWYVSGGAPSGGTGAADSPFESLARAETASGAGDTIVVQPSMAVLDGGIALKAGQKLVGAGDSVVGAANGVALPRITNTTGNHDGDAVRLAPGAEVRNLVVDGARRGGIYGRDAADVVIAGNVVTGTNRNCADGFIIGPFTLPPTIPIGVSADPLPNFITLNNGWAAIMTDFTTAAGNVAIDGNLVHNTACGDGIDVRAHGTSRVHADLTGNALRDINLGLAKLSVLAMGLQAGDSAQLDANLIGNSQIGIAPLETSPLNHLADSEGVFINALGRARLDVIMDRNEFRDGHGNFSANGLEYVTTSGTPDSRVTVTNSTFDTVRGDIIENYNLSADGARQSLTLDNVRAHRSSFPAGALNPIIPANLGSCLVATNFGRTGHTDLTVTNSSFGDCSADGVGLIAYTPTGSGPATAELVFDIRDTTIAGTAANGLNIINIGDTATLRGTVERTDISAAQGSLIRTRNSGGTNVAVEFGPGTLEGAAVPCLASTHPRIDMADSVIRSCP